MLHRYVQAVAPDVVPDETRFLELAKRLRDGEVVRRNATEAAELVRCLGLPFGEDETWTIHIAIPLRGSTEKPLIAPSSVHLQIRPEPEWQWDMAVRIAKRGQFTETERKISRNDLGLSDLGHSNPRTFPQWLSKVRQHHDFDFDTGAADIRVGRNRAAPSCLHSG